MNTRDRLGGKIEAQLREWTAELEKLEANADKTVAGAQKEYYEHVDEPREQNRDQAPVLEAAQEKAEGAEATARTLIERFHPAIQARVRDLRPVLDDLRTKAEQAERRPSVWRRRCAPHESPPAPPSAG